MQETPASSDVTPWIDINGLKHEILCGYCHTPISFRSEPDSHSDKAGCVFCNTFADIQHVAAVAIVHATCAANQALYRDRGGVRDSKSISFSKDASLLTAFVVDLKL